MREQSLPLASLTTLITKGTTPTTIGFDFVDEGVPFLRVQNIFGGQVHRSRDTLFIDASTHAALKRSSIQGGDVLVTIAGTIGRVGVVDDEVVDLNCNQAVAIVRTLPAIDRSFLRHWLESPGARKQMLGSTVTGTIANLSLAQLGALKVPLPPLAEQRRIAAILDQVETLRAQRRAAITQLDSLGQAVFLEMFGDPVNNPKNWPFVRFGELGSLDRGVSKHRPRNAPQLLGGRHPLVQTGEVANCDGYIDRFTHTYSDVGLKQSKLWPAGTLCITIAANIAKTGILKFAACFPDSVVGFSAPDAATVEFARVWLSFLQKALEESAPESAQKNINLAILRDLKVPLPPLALQQCFARRIQSIEQLKATHRTALAHLDELFASLQHRAFRGELTSRAVNFEGLRQLEATAGLEALIFVARRTGGHDLYASLKTLYVADKIHLEQHGQLIYGETYNALPMGPVPEAAYLAVKLLRNEDMFCPFDEAATRAAIKVEGNRLIPLRDADLSKLGSAAIQSLEAAIRYFTGATFEEVKRATHDAAYERTAPNAPILVAHLIDTLPPEARKRHWNLEPSAE